MKILLITIDWFDPAYRAGGPTRSVMNLINLISDSYEIYVLTGNQDYGTDEELRGIDCDQWVKHKSGVYVQYLSHRRRKIKIVEEMIKSVNPDIVYLNSQYSTVFTLYPIVCKRFFDLSKAMYILAPRGMLQDGAMGHRRRLKNIYNWIMRSFLLTEGFRFHATDLQEAKDICNHLQVDRSKLFVIANVPVNPQRYEFKAPEAKKDPLRLVWISRIASKKNMAGLLSALSLLHIEIELDVYGLFDNKQYRSLCFKEVRKLPSNVKVSFYGHLITDPIETIHSYHAFILPTWGENFGHAIYEALVAGRPVIIGTATPWNDIAVNEAGWLVLPDRLDTIRAAIEDLQSLSPDDHLEMCRNAYLYATEFYNRYDFASAYKEMFG